MVNLKSSITVTKLSLLYVLNTFQAQPLTELMPLSLPLPADRPVNHHSDKHLPFFSHFPTVIVCWTVKSFRRFKFFWGFYFVNDSSLPLTKQGRETSRGNRRERQHLFSTTANNFFFFKFWPFWTQKTQVVVSKETRAAHFSWLLYCHPCDLTPLHTLHILTYPEQCKATVTIL